MQLIFYENQNKDQFDSLREYCLCERVNEEHLRTLIQKRSSVIRKAVQEIASMIKKL